MDQIDILSAEGILKSISREGFREIWEAARAGNAAKLNVEEQKIARIMLQHQDKYENQFDFTDISLEQAFKPGNEGDPFVHILVHLAVENQIECRELIEVSQFYLSMRKRKCDHHQAVHFINIVFMHSLFDAIKCKTSFDYEIYRNELRRLKKETTENIVNHIEKGYQLFTRH
jgi:hypothetical protein